MNKTQPDEREVLTEIDLVVSENPEFGQKRVANALKERNPNWTLSEKRVIKLLKKYRGSDDKSSSQSGSSNGNSPWTLDPHSGNEPASNGNGHRVTETIKEVVKAPVQAMTKKQDEPVKEPEDNSPKASETTASDVRSSQKSTDARKSEERVSEKSEGDKSSKMSAIKHKVMDKADEVKERISGLHSEEPKPESPQKEAEQPKSPVKESEQPQEPVKQSPEREQVQPKESPKKEEVQPKELVKEAPEQPKEEPKKEEPKKEEPKDEDMDYVKVEGKDGENASMQGYEKASVTPKNQERPQSNTALDRDAENGATCACIVM